MDNEVMMMATTVIKIRAKKIGILIRNARQANKRSVEECAQTIGVPISTFEAYESGEVPPTLPDLEAIAYLLDIPLEHFWEDQVFLTGYLAQKEVNFPQWRNLRQHIIGANLKKARTEAGLSAEALAEKIGISPQQLEAYEYGDPIPLPELESICEILAMPLKGFQDQEGLVGMKLVQQRTLQEYLEIPENLRSFIETPVNRPYLELAMRLSEMSVDKLRTVAEGLLEITL